MKFILQVGTVLQGSYQIRSYYTYDQTFDSKIRMSAASMIR